MRKEDRTLFSPSLRFLVLDELHSYRGALATEIACLIRRLKARAGVGDGKLRCIGTSATVSKDAGGDEALAGFVSSLFGEPFSREDVIGETLVVKTSPEAANALTDQELRTLNRGLLTGGISRDGERPAQSASEAAHLLPGCL